MLGNFLRRKKRVTYLFTGYYGFDNFGDDLFPLACHYALEQDRDGKGAVILSPPIGGIDANFLVPRSLSKLYRGNGVLSKLTRVFFLLYGVLLHRNLVLAGGSTIASGSSLSMRRLQLLLSNLKLCDLYAIGVSVGPFYSKKDELFAGEFISSLRFLAVRDGRSRIECQKLKLSVIPHVHNDLAGSLPVEKILNEDSCMPSDKPVLGISICPYESVVGKDTKVENSRNKAIFEGVADFGKRYGYKIRIMVLNGNEAIGDHALSKDLFKHVKNAGVEAELLDYQGAVSTLCSIKKCNIFFSVRLHGGIAAYLLDVPFVLFEYHKKCSDFLDHIGVRSNTRILSGSMTSTSVFQALDNVRGNYTNPATSVQEYRDESLKNFSFTERRRNDI